MCEAQIVNCKLSNRKFHKLSNGKLISPSIQRERATHKSRGSFLFSICYRNGGWTNIRFASTLNSIFRQKVTLYFELFDEMV